MKRKKVFDEITINKFAYRLKIVRQEKNLTQESLALKSGLSLSQIARIETSQINPTLSTIAVIAKTLGVEIGYLFE